MSNYQTAQWIAAQAAYRKPAIGGCPVYGIPGPEWFLDEFQKFLELKPEAASWDARRIQSTMEGLYLLDPEDLL